MFVSSLQILGLFRFLWINGVPHRDNPSSHKGSTTRITNALPHCFGGFAHCFRALTACLQDRFINSTCKLSFGFTLEKTTIVNPVDFVKSQASKVVPQRMLALVCPRSFLSVCVRMSGSVRTCSRYLEKEQPFFF
jgi:hypothetical protein